MGCMITCTRGADVWQSLLFIVLLGHVEIKVWVCMITNSRHVALHCERWKI